MRRKGFTLIELLVVIAIIGILASMVFPVFARARESARKAVCLSNVKNLALAVQMYLADNNDQFWTRKGDDVAQAYFNMGIARAPKENCNRAYQANPFLRVPVRLDEYVKNRDVWNCPSAKLEAGASFILASYGYWLDTYRDNEGLWGTGTAAGGPCYVAWPPGWGGVVTDSIAQGTHAKSLIEESDDGIMTDVFKASIGVNGDIMYNEVKFVEIQDPVRYVVLGDTGAFLEFSNINGIAFPDGCKLTTCCESDPFVCSDWVNCPWSQACSIGSVEEADMFFNDSTFRNKFCRHLGGTNIGFADGHAAWWPAMKIIDAAYNVNYPDKELDLFGACACWP